MNDILRAEDPLMRLLNKKFFYSQEKYSSNAVKGDRQGIDRVLQEPKVYER